MSNSRLRSPLCNDLFNNLLNLGYVRNIIIIRRRSTAKSVGRFQRRLLLLRFKLLIVIDSLLYISFNHL